MAVVKGKQGTKGQKQIHEDNLATVRFYLYMCAAGSCLHFAVCCLLFFETTSTLHWVCFAVSVLLQVGGVYFMRYMSKAFYGPTGQLLDAGLDINMPGGVAEYCKDVVILATGLQFLSILSTYCWLLFVVCPLYVFYLAWQNIISPWLSVSSSNELETDEKKRRKKERKLVH